MSSIVSRFKVLALTVLALCGLTALMATSAQANWLENGAAITANKTVLAKAHTEGRLLVRALNFEIRCPELEAEALTLIAGTKEATGKANFLKCEGFKTSTGELLKNCTPHSTGAAAGTVVAGGKALDVKLAPVVGSTLKEYILFEPSTVGGAFTTIELPELCALAETSEIRGSLVAECGELQEVKPKVKAFVAEECSVAQKVHLLQSATQIEFFNGTNDLIRVEDKLIFGENKATVDGIAAVELKSENPWAGDA